MKVLAENIRRLRKEKNLTQEELAGFLQVSFQTISKWERRETLPDIAMLPVLAGFFEISVDELLGLNQSKEQKKRNEILKTWEKNNSAGKNMENVDLLRTALKSFPSDYFMMLKLITSLEKCDGTSEEVALYKNEALELSERILKHCPDYNIRNETAFNICFSYFRSGNPVLAIEKAKQLPKLGKSQENALVMLQKGCERIQTGQQAIIDLLSSLFHQISCMCREEYYSHEEQLELLQKYFDVCHILFEEHDVAEITHRMAEGFVLAADINLELNRTKEAIEYLERAAKLLEQKSDKDSNGRSCNLICNAIEPTSVVNTDYKKRWLIEKLSSDRYAKLKNNPQFHELRRRFSHELL